MTTRRKLPIRMADLVDAMCRGPGEDWVLNLANGEMWPRDPCSLIGGMDWDDGEEDTDGEGADDSDEGDPTANFERVPRYEREYELMRQFADDLDEEEVHEQLMIALQGKGAFGRFRTVIHRHPDLRDRWLAYRERVVGEEAREWLESIGVEPEEPPKPVPPSPPPLATPQHQIDLVHLLVLGGKVELIEGRVLRSISTDSPAEAKKLFVHLARQVCEHHGVEWRRRFIEGKSEYRQGDMFLEVDGTTVGLWLTVARETWRRFCR